MAEPRTCSECGAVLPSSAPGGLCVPCLLLRGLADSIPPEAAAVAADQQTAPEPPRPARDTPSTRIGRYRLLEKLGEGGCGTVYLAEQELPVKRQVALKVIKPGMDTREVVARFETERQALALMDHPNIAKVLDAGAAESGTPYFVMELVRGLRITDYCDQHGLTTRERLDLFAQICQAIQHAHQKGIIHRDIKPSNILVSVNDGVPVPKVIDFGIAKATQGRLTDKTLFTALQQFMGTPAYMSPEQAEMTGLDIDTRSDIYSLGVLLYELLTGRTPFDARQLLAAGLDAMRRTIREEEPSRPSTRLTTMLASDLTVVARHRHTEAPRLISTVRGDLDWIVMKALEKDRTRRYETANGLAMDIQRFLQDEPVTAGPPSSAYRLRKFVRRHQAVVTATAALTLVLLAGIAGTTWGLLRSLRQKQEAQRQAQIARQASDFVAGMFRQIDPAVAKLREITVREVLDQAGQNIGSAFPEEPLTELPIRKAISTIYAKLGRDDLALPQAEAAFRLAKAACGERDDPQVAESTEDLASCLAGLGRSVEALPKYEAALAMKQRLYRGDHPLVVHSFDNVGSCLRDLGRWNEALTNFEAAVTMRERLSHGDHNEAAACLNDQAACLSALGRRDEAMQKSQEALGMFQRLADAAPEKKSRALDLAKAHLKMGDLFAARSQPDQAAQSYRTGLALAESLSVQPGSDATRVKLVRNFRLRLGLDRAEVAVAQVSPAGQAQRLGLRKGDVLLRYAGQPITSSDHLGALTGGLAGKGDELQVRRGDQVLHFTVEPGKLGIATEDPLPPAR